MLLIAKKIYKERLYSDFELLESITSLLLNNKDKYEFGVCLFTLRSFIESSKWETGSVFALRIDFSSKDEYLVPNETYWSIFDSKLVQMLFFLKDSNYENRRRVLKSLKALHVICLDRLAIWDTIYSPYAGEEGKDLMKRPINVISEPSMISDFIYYYQDASCPSVQNRVFKDYNDYHSKEKTFLRNTFNEFSSRMNHALAGGHVQRILYVFEDSYEYLKNKLDKLVTEDLLLVKIIKNWKALVQIISVSPVDMISAETLKKEIDKLSSKIFDEPKLEFHARGNLYRAIIESAKKEPVFDGRMMNILRDYHAYVTSKKLGMNVDTFKRFTGWVKRQNK
jgi:hypothetical protein